MKDDIESYVELERLIDILAERETEHREQGDLHSADRAAKFRKQVQEQLNALAGVMSNEDLIAAETLLSDEV